MTAGSLLAPLLIGVALGDLLHGVPINSSQNYTGSFWDLLQPYALFTGITLVLICVLHGATFLTLKTTGEMRERSRAHRPPGGPGDRRRRRGASPSGPTWRTAAPSCSTRLNCWPILAVLAAVWLVYEHREGFAFAATTVTMASCIVAIFVGLYPERDGLQHQRGQQPHRAQHRVRRRTHSRP